MFVSAMQPQLLPLIGTLSDQNQSIYEYLTSVGSKGTCCFFWSVLFVEVLYAWLYPTYSPKKRGYL